jgi:uncharacterized protein (DUF1697 family)
MPKNNIYAALLRGINVGGNTIVSMAELKIVFEKLGCRNVNTYINSGNVVFEASSDTRKLEDKIEKALEKHFLLRIPVIVKNYDEMKSIVENLPSSWRSNKDERRNVMFLRHEIDSPDILKKLNPKPGIEELHYHPGVLFWSAQTSNLTKSSMLKVSNMPIYKQMTIRNLNTTLKVFSLMQELS